MNLLLLRDSDFISETQVRITGRRLLHLNSVHKAAVGDFLKTGVLGGKIGLAKIEKINELAAELSVELNEEPPAPLPVTLVVGLPRPKSLLRIVFAATQMGIKNIHFTHSFRVEKSYWHCEQIQPKKLEAACIKGLEQCRDTVMPQLHFHRRFKPFVEDELVKIIAGSSAWVAHPYAKSQLPASDSGAVTLAIGPEGGFIDYEIDKLCEVGFSAGSLGKRILTLETALPTLVSHIWKP